MEDINKSNVFYVLQNSNTGECKVIYKDYKESQLREDVFFLLLCDNIIKRDMNSRSQGNKVYKLV